jgi:hypothetical protein
LGKGIHNRAERGGQRGRGESESECISSHRLKTDDCVRAVIFFGSLMVYSFFFCASAKTASPEI